MSGFKSFYKDQRGNFATIFALSMVPIFGIIGAAIDYSRASEVEAKLSEALDAGVLAVGTQPEMSDAEAYKIVNGWVSAHLGPAYEGYWHLNSVTVGDDGTILASASGGIDTMMGRLLGLDKIPIDTASEAVRSTGKVEVALVLDNTGSMEGQKLRDLKKAAKAFVDTLVAATDDPEDLRIALVPFSQTVNISDLDKQSWVDTQAKSSVHDDIFTKADGTTNKANRFDLFKEMDVDWAGCIESRPSPYDVQEDAPSASNPDSLYVPYFAPDEPTKGSGSGKNFKPYYNNDYVTDIAAPKEDKMSDEEWWRSRQGNVDKYKKAKPKTGRADNEAGSILKYSFGPNSGCELEPLRPLTKDASKTGIDALKLAIDRMKAVGNTHINIGLQWGWHMLSPNSPLPADNKGVAYDDGEWRKVVVLMTDGNNENQTTRIENKNDSIYSGYGYVWQDRFGSFGDNPSKSARTKALDGKLATLCKNMKDRHITIYTVRVEVREGSNQTLKDCASQPDFFAEVANSNSLSTEFMEIAGSIQALRLSK